jgi:hypothetical protein
MDIQFAFLYHFITCVNTPYDVSYCAEIAGPNLASEILKYSNHYLSFLSLSLFGGPDVMAGVWTSEQASHKQC